jgi:hypothetical protein
MFMASNKSIGENKYIHTYLYSYFVVVSKEQRENNFVRSFIL